MRADGSGAESTREWRNRILASYLGVRYTSIPELTAAVCQAMPRLTQTRARSLLASHTGITHHYTAIRPRTRRYVFRHAETVCKLFVSVSSRALAREAKVKKVAARLAGMPMISTPTGGSTPPFNPLTPVLACLDPSRRFPIMNQRTHRLLNAIGQSHDAEGALALYHIIGTHGVRDSFELDVYSHQQFVPARRFRPRRARTHESARRPRKGLPIGIKTELDSFAKLAARRVRIRREHNKLINRFRRAVFAEFAPQEADFDLLIRAWKAKRDLLIEAKTDWRGPVGRTQIRQAIGQLFDYRLQHFPKATTAVDLALLVPTEPSSDIKALLQSLGIAALWFDGRRIKGTVRVPW